MIVMMAFSRDMRSLRQSRFAEKMDTSVPQPDDVTSMYGWSVSFEGDSESRVLSQS